MRLFNQDSAPSDSGVQAASPSVLCSRAGIRLTALFVAAFLTVVAAAFLTFGTSGQAQSSDAVSAEKAASMAAKGDRTPTACDGQAWGAWNESCAAALSGGNQVRNVGFVTVEQPSPVSNETILARFQAAE